jgi:hypothetical protein
MNVKNYRWKYCPDHISNDAIKTWDCSVFSYFIDLKSNETLSSTTCDALFKNRTFEEIITHPSVQQSESTQKMKFPFENIEQPLQKLKRACPKKTKNGSIKTLLSKKKSSTNKKKCQLRMSDTSGSKNTQSNSAKNKWTPLEEADEIEEIEGPEEIEEPDETEINELDEEDDNESGAEDESEGDDDEGIDEDEQTEDNDEEEIDEEEDDKSLDIKISMPRQKRPKLIYHV